MIVDITFKQKKKFKFLISLKNDQNRIKINRQLREYIKEFQLKFLKGALETTLKF